MNKTGTFKKIIDNLDKLYTFIQKGECSNLDVRIRCNVDKTNISEFLDLKFFIEERYNFYFLVDVAKVQGAGDVSKDINIFSDEEYSQLITNFYKNNECIPHLFLPEITPKFKHCSSNSPNAYVFDPAGNIYKCSLDAGKKQRIVGGLETKYLNNNTEANYLLNTTLLLPDECKTCCLLFFCWGGCVRRRINKGMKKECVYHKYCIDDLIIGKYEVDQLDIKINEYEVL